MRKLDYSPWHPVLLPFICWGWLILFVAGVYDAAPPSHSSAGTGPSNADGVWIFAPVAIVVLAAILQLICGLPLLWVFRRVNTLFLRLLIALLPPLTPCLFIGRHSREDMLLAALLLIPPFIFGTLYIHRSQER